jgi:hypothetical protein
MSFTPRTLAAILAATFALAALAVGINRLVVTDGHIQAKVAFKSDYLPLG